jgi:hypothetical protein
MNAVGVNVVMVKNFAGILSAHQSSSGTLWLDNHGAGTDYLYTNDQCIRADAIDAAPRRRNRR